MIKLTDVLDIDPTKYKDYKVHFAIGEKNQLEKLEMFYAGTFIDDQNIQTQDNFSTRYVISLIFIGSNKWMFAGLYEKLSGPDRLTDGNVKYNLILTENQSDLIGRVIVSYERTYRASYTFLETLISKEHELEIVQVTENKFSIIDFPGYDKVDISYTQLQTIITNSLTTWNIALKNAKGIYLITDSISGKHYVGKASGKEAIWQRWSAYSNNGHGDNVSLKELVKSKNGYEKNFRFSILEVCSLNTEALYIDDRESYWKSILLSKRPFGLNEN